MRQLSELIGLGKCNNHGIQKMPEVPEHILWNIHGMNDTGPYWRFVNTDSCNVFMATMAWCCQAWNHYQHQWYNRWSHSQTSRRWMNKYLDCIMMCFWRSPTPHTPHRTPTPTPTPNFTHLTLKNIIVIRTESLDSLIAIGCRYLETVLKRRVFRHNNSGSLQLLGPFHSHFII